MTVSRALHLLALLLGPSAIAGLAVALPRLTRALRNGLRRLSAGQELRPAGPPLEQLAADLRRLLAEHARLRRSPAVTRRGHRLAALEGAITDCALDAARALDLPPPQRVGRQALPPPALRQLLADLARVGVVLPGHERFGR